MSEIVKHSDIKNCKTHSDTVQVNKIVECKGYYVRVTVMGWMRSSVTLAMKRMEAIAESVKFIKDWIEKTPVYLHPGKFDAGAYWNNLGDQGMTVGINIKDGSIFTAAMRQQAHANKFTAYEQLAINAIDALITAKPKMRNIYHVMELIGLYACTNNHYTLSTSLLNLACSVDHPVLDSTGPLPEMGIFEMVIDDIKKTTGSFTKGPNDRCTVFKNGPFIASKMRDLMGALNKVRRGSVASSNKLSHYDSMRVMKYFMEVLSELNKPKPGSGMFSLQTVIRVMAAIGLNHVTGLCKMATMAPDVTHFKGKSNGEDADTKPNHCLREYLQSMEKSSFVSSAVLVQDGIIDQICRCDDIPDHCYDIDHVAQENIYCEERRRRKRCDPFLPGGMHWYEAIVISKTNGVLIQRHTPVQDDGTYKIITEKVSPKKFLGGVNTSLPSSLIWKPAVTKIEQEKLRAHSIPIKLPEDVPHEDVAFVRLSRAVLKSKGLWSQVKNEFAVNSMERDLPLHSRYKNSIERLNGIDGLLDVAHEQLLIDISPKGIGRMKEKDNRRARLHMLETASWVDQQKLIAVLGSSRFYKDNSRRVQEDTDTAEEDDDNDYMSDISDPGVEVEEIATSQGEEITASEEGDFRSDLVHPASVSKVRNKARKTHKKNKRRKIGTRCSSITLLLTI